MENIITKLFKIVFKTNVGNINEKRAEALSKNFAGEFEVRILQEQPLGKVFILANPVRREAILIEPNTITYQVEFDTAPTPDFSKLKNYIQTISETLLLDDVCEGLIHIVGQLSSSELNAMDRSIGLFTHEDLQRQMPNLKGVGIRYILEHETGLWEYKVEPFINDPKYFFLEMICNINTPMHIIDIIGISENSYHDFIDGKKGVLECLGIS